MWQRAWINAVDSFTGTSWAEPFRLVHNEGVGLISQGSREWRDYVGDGGCDATPCDPSRCGGEGAGAKRYYAFVLARDNKVQLMQVLHDETILAEKEFAWSFGETLEMSLSVAGDQLVGSINGEKVIEATSDTFSDGSMGLLIEEGRTATQAVRVQPGRIILRV